MENKQQRKPVQGDTTGKSGIFMYNPYAVMWFILY